MGIYKHVYFKVLYLRRPVKLVMYGKDFIGTLKVSLSPLRKISLVQYWWPCHQKHLSNAYIYLISDVLF